MNEFFFKKIGLHVLIAINVFNYVSRQVEQVSFSFLQSFFRFNSETLSLLESPNHPNLDRQSIFLNL